MSSSVDEEAAPLTPRLAGSESGGAEEIPVEAETADSPPAAATPASSESGERTGLLPDTPGPTERSIAFVINCPSDDPDVPKLLTTSRSSKYFEELKNYRREEPRLGQLSSAGPTSALTYSSRLSAPGESALLSDDSCFAISPVQAQRSEESPLVLPEDSPVPVDRVETEEEVMVSERADYAQEVASVSEATSSEPAEAVYGEVVFASDDSAYNEDFDDYDKLSSQLKEPISRADEDENTTTSGVPSPVNEFYPIGPSSDHASPPQDSITDDQTVMFEKESTTYSGTKTPYSDPLIDSPSEEQNFMGSSRTFESHEYAAISADEEPLSADDRAVAVVLGFTENDRPASMSFNRVREMAQQHILQALDDSYRPEDDQASVSEEIPRLHEEGYSQAGASTGALSTGGTGAETASLPGDHDSVGCLDTYRDTHYPEEDQQAPVCILRYLTASGNVLNECPEPRPETSRLQEQEHVYNDSLENVDTEIKPSSAYGIYPTFDKVTPPDLPGICHPSLTTSRSSLSRRQEMPADDSLLFHEPFIVQSATNQQEETPSAMQTPSSVQMNIPEPPLNPLPAQEYEPQLQMHQYMPDPSQYLPQPSLQIDQSFSTNNAPASLPNYETPMAQPLPPQPLEYSPTPLQAPLPLTPHYQQYQTTLTPIQQQPFVFPENTYSPQMVPVPDPHYLISGEPLSADRWQLPSREASYRFEPLPATHRSTLETSRLAQAADTISSWFRASPLASLFGSRTPPLQPATHHTTASTFAPQRSTFVAAQPAPGSAGPWITQRSVYVDTVSKPVEPRRQSHQTLPDTLHLMQRPEIRNALPTLPAVTVSESPVQVSTPHSSSATRPQLSLARPASAPHPLRRSQLRPHPDQLAHSNARPDLQSPSPLEMSRLCLTSRPALTGASATRHQMVDNLPSFQQMTAAPRQVSDRPASAQPSPVTVRPAATHQSVASIRPAPQQYAQQMARPPSSHQQPVMPRPASSHQTPLRQPSSHQTAVRDIVPQQVPLIHSPSRLEQTQHHSSERCQVPWPQQRSPLPEARPQRLALPSEYRSPGTEVRQASNDKARVVRAPIQRMMTAEPSLIASPLLRPESRSSVPLMQRATPRAPCAPAKIYTYNEATPSPQRWSLIKAEEPATPSTAERSPPRPRTPRVADVARRSAPPRSRGSSGRSKAGEGTRRRRSVLLPNPSLIPEVRRANKKSWWNCCLGPLEPAN